MGRTILALFCTLALAQTPAEQTEASAAFTKYCATCHSERLKTGGVVIDPASIAKAADKAELWERVIHQLRARSMPPPSMPRPDEATYNKMALTLERTIDRAASVKPNPGDVSLVRRLTRTEYENAIRDLLAVENLPKELDYRLLLPADNSSSGFDNLADLLFLSPPVMERYLDAAKKISRVAIGDMEMQPLVNIHRIPVQSPQDDRLEDQPLGTRGGLSVHSYFPLDGEYTFKIELAGGAREQHQIEIAIDGERKQLFSIGGPGAGRGRGGAGIPEARFAVKAGPHAIGITFLLKTEAIDENTVRPRTRSRGTMPAISAVTIGGPFKPTGSGNTPSREKIFVCTPKAAAEEALCADKILTALTRRAYRRPSAKADVTALMPFFEAGKKEAGFDRGIQRALERLLVSPQFLYRIERDPANVSKAYRIPDLDLATRLSFFLWSTVPDDELLNLAAQNKLRTPGVLEQQVKRMLADERADTLVNNFASQWLFLRDIRIKDPDLYLFRDFDEGLRDAMAKETELFVSSVLREDRSVTDLLTANYSFVNERLAKHYGIPNIHGSQFRKYTFPAGSPRGGLLGQGSILTLTSYSTRTSPVLRGKYVLENLLASPPPPPPPDVPSLKTEGAAPGETLSMRKAMEQHRANPACASCHARMDPIGFAMENFDAVGRWRNNDNGQKLDVVVSMPEGKFEGIAGVKQLLMKDPQRFVSSMAERLMMFGIGRNVQYYDRPALREIVRQSAADNFKFSSIIIGVVKSVPFQMREPRLETKADVKGGAQ